MPAARVLTIVLLAFAVAFGVPDVARAQTNYPLQETFVIRDANGRLITGTTPTCPEDALAVHATGWLANSTVTATFFSTAIPLGKFPVNGSGVLDFTFRVPDVENGMHTLRLEGTGANGQPRTLEAPVLCECRRATSNQPSAVLGQTVNAGGGGGGSGTFARTGTDVMTLLVVGFDLIVIGLAIRIAFARSRRTARLS